MWTNHWMKRRSELDESENLLKEIASEDPDSYLNVLRMTE